MIDKISADEARADRDLQDEMVVRAIDRHFGIKREAITTGMIRELREIALGSLTDRATSPGASTSTRRRDRLHHQSASRVPV
jgi:hypothetical protein